MLSPTTAKGLLGHFPHGADPPTTYQSASPPPVQLPISFSLRAISAAGDGGKGAQGGASGSRSPRDGEGGGGGSGGKEQEQRRGDKRQDMGGDEDDGGDKDDNVTGVRRTGPHRT